MNRIPKIFDLVSNSEFGRQFLSGNPVSGSAVPLGVAEAIGQLSRHYFAAGMKVGLLPKIVLSRLLLGYEGTGNAEISYDRYSLINTYDSMDLEFANNALHSILSYVKLSEALTHEYDYLTQLVRHTFKDEDASTIHIFTPNTNVGMFDEDIACQVQDSELDKPIQLVMTILEDLTSLIRESSTYFDKERLSLNDYALPLDTAAINERISKWVSENVVALKEWKRFDGAKARAILMLATMNQLGPEWAFVAVPGNLHGEDSFYSWAGLWAIIHLPSDAHDLDALRDQLYALSIIAHEILMQIQHYAYRLETWQRQVLFGRREIYDSLMASEFLPRVLDCPVQQANTVIQHPLWGKPITFEKFFPQIPFSGCSNKYIVHRLRPFLDIRRSGITSDERQIIQSALHDLQSGKIENISKSASDFSDTMNLIEKRINGIAPEIISRSDRESCTTQDDIRRYLHNLATEISSLGDVREYLRTCIAQRLCKWSSSNGAQKKGLSSIFRHKLMRDDFKEWNWSTLNKRYADRYGIADLPFSISYLNRTCEALLHNFEKYSGYGETSELYMLETERSIALRWSVGGERAPFENVQQFKETVLRSLRNEGSKGIHRGLPLSLAFGLETGAEEIRVWLREGKNGGGWHDLLPVPYVDVENYAKSPERNNDLDADLNKNCTYALQWVWAIDNQAANS